MVHPGAGYIALSWTCIMITMPMVLNRFYVRYMKHSGGFGKVWTWGDILVLVAWCFNVGQTSCDTLLYRAGALKYDRSDFSPEQNRYAYKIFFVENMIYWVPLYCIKGAILCFYLEIAPPVLRGIRIAIWFAAALVLFGLAFNEANFLLICRPISLNWDDYGGGSCKNSYTVSIAIGLHMFTDVFIYAIPFFLVTKIDIPTLSQKLATASMFFTGFLLVLLSLPNFLSYIIPAMYNPFMWAFYVGIMEQTMSVVVACLPSLRVTLTAWWRDGVIGRSARRAQRSAMERRGSRGGGTDLSTQVIRDRIADSISKGSTKNSKSLTLGSKGSTLVSRNGGGMGPYNSPTTLEKESQWRLDHSIEMEEHVGDDEIESCPPRRTFSTRGEESDWDLERGAYSVSVVSLGQQRG